MDSDLLRVRLIFQAARLCNPRRINDVAPAAIPELLQRFKFVAQVPNRLERLLEELALYRALALGLTDVQRDLGQWWIGKREELPEWSSLALTAASPFSLVFSKTASPEPSR